MRVEENAASDSPVAEPSPSPQASNIYSRRFLRARIDGFQAFHRVLIAPVGEGANADQKHHCHAITTIDERGKIHGARSAAASSKADVRLSMMEAQSRAVTSVMKHR